MASIHPLHYRHYRGGYLPLFLQTTYYYHHMYHSYTTINKLPYNVEDRQAFVKKGIQYLTSYGAKLLPKKGIRTPTTRPLFPF